MVLLVYLKRERNGTPMLSTTTTTTRAAKQFPFPQCENSHARKIARTNRSKKPRTQEKRYPNIATRIYQTVGFSTGFRSCEIDG
jgi:hypothetical protein